MLFIAKKQVQGEGDMWHTDEENVQRAKHGVLKQSFQEDPSEASKLVSLHQVAEVPFVV